MRTRPHRRVSPRVVVTLVAALLLTLTAPFADQPLRSAPGPGPDAVGLAAVQVASDADLARLASFDLAEARHGDHVEVVVWPGDLARLSATGLPYRILTTDLAATTTAQGYRHLADYERELRELADRFPGHVRLLEGPHPTFEGRTVFGVEIGDRVAGADGRPVAMILGLHHAREWPSGELTMDFARELAEGHGVEPRITALLGTVRVVLVPVVNPDGFHHSRESALDKPALGVVAGGRGAYWRKNRRGPALGDVNPIPYGVDPNRNYGQRWGGGRPVLGTTSSNPLDQSYQGEAPFSEPESANVRHWVLTRPVVALVTNHTYSDLVLWPWGWTKGPSPDADGLARLGTELARFNRYTPMQSSQLYPTTGTTEDWAYATTGTYGFTFEHGAAFHPAYHQTYGPLYQRNRGAFLHLLDAAADTGRHSVIEGQVTATGPAGPEGTLARLSLRRTGSLPLTPTNPGRLDELTETVDLAMTTDPDGHFRWHVNPSTRPVAAGPEAYELTVTLPDGQFRTTAVNVERGGVASLGTVGF